MATLVTSLSSNGVLFCKNIDEVTYTTNKISTNTLYSGNFDEVTYYSPTLGYQKESTNSVFVSKYFDEITLNS
jgi:hypothetical protein